MEPNDALRDLVKGDRPKSLADAAWVRGMLADLCPETEHRRQVNLLVLAQSEGVARDLAVISNGSIDGFAVARLVARLVDNHDTAPESARWAVGRWAEALGVSIAPGIELRPPKSVSGPPPTPPHAAVSAALQSTTEPEPLVPLKQVKPLSLSARPHRTGWFPILRRSARRCPSAELPLHNRLIVVPDGCCLLLRHWCAGSSRYR